MPNITYTDKDKNASGAEDMWRDVDANEVKNVVNQKQDLNTNLTALSGVVGASGFFKKVAPGTWVLTDPERLQVSRNVPAHGFVVKNALTLTIDGDLVKVSDPSNQKLVAVVTEVIDVDNFKIALPGGYVTGLSGLTAGAIHYGQADGTISTVVTDMPVLFADSTTTAYLLASGGAVPDLTKVLTKGNNGGGLQIKNIADPTDPQDSATKAYADGLVVGLWDDRGSFDASVNAYPSSGGSGVAGAIKKGDIWTISVAGTLPTDQVVEAGDTVRALIDTPGNTQANWSIQQNNIGYVPENVANKGAANGYSPLGADSKVPEANIKFGSETESGSGEEATDAETASGTAVGGTGAKLFVTPAKLITWWTAIKTAAQTIAAKWTFNDVALTNQIQSGKKVGVFIDTDGTLKKVAEAVYDSTLKKWVFTGSDTSSSTVSARWENSALELILELYNDKVVKFGGDSAIFEVNAGTESGNAALRFLSYLTGAGLGFRFQDNLLNAYIDFRSLTTDRGVVLRQPVEYNYGVGELVFTRQFKLTLPNTTASANHVLFEYTLAEEEHFEIKIEKAEAIALTSDAGKSITSSFGTVDTADVRRITAGTIEGNTVVSAQSRLPNTVLTGGFNWVIDTGTNKIQYCFRNGASPDNETYDVFVHISVVKRNTPV